MTGKKKVSQEHEEQMDLSAETDDVVYDEDQGAELVKKLRAKLKKCEEEKKANLDGWQRCQADAMNAKKTHAQALTNARERAVSDFVHNLLPALDSFDMAFQGEAWEKVDDVWRKGVEYVHSQLINSLESQGITVFGAVGEKFDPALHEAISHEEGGASDTIARVARRGYKFGDTIIRAAQVVVYQ